MKLIDNNNSTLEEDLIDEIKNGSKIQIAAASFSIYAFDRLKKELQNIDELRFIFTSPTFIKQKEKKAKKEFDIHRREREKSLHGNEYEVKLRNEMTQKSIAKECAEWIRNKVKFKSNSTSESMLGFMNLDDKTYYPLNDFTTVDLGVDKGNNAYRIIQKLDASYSEYYLKLFDDLWSDDEKYKDVTEEVIESITNVYNENSPNYIYFLTLYNIFSEFLEDVSEDELPNESTGFKNSKIWNMLYNFQKDAALAIINKLEKYNGCILADSVGLGKTFTALSVIKYYENRNKSVLVLCPKKLSENWNTYKANYTNNIIAQDRLRYDVLFHTDLNREKGESNGINLERINWGNYDLVVIDESHNFRNGGKVSGEDEKENRYLKLMNKVIKRGVKTKVLMLSATPVNNKFLDLKNQLALAYEGDTNQINDKLKTKKNIDEIFKQTQRGFNEWSKLGFQERTSEELLNRLDSDFFEILDSVTIARSRKHIEKYYDTKELGKFPKRNIPISKRPGLTDLDNAINYSEIFEELNSLNLFIYTPSEFILPSKIYKYQDKYDETEISGGLTQKGRERGIQRLTAINLMKRLESSVHSFRLTLNRIESLINSTIKKINAFEKTKKSTTLEMKEYLNTEFDGDDLEDDLFTIGKKVKIDLEDMDYLSWRKYLLDDKEILDILISMVSDITPEHDEKLNTLYKLIDDKEKNPINPGNKKIIIFTAFADTAEYLYKNVSKYVKDKYNLDSGLITGSTDGKTTIKNLKVDLNTTLTLFSPLSKGKEELYPNRKEEIDILIATDVISEGQNLQDCDYLINYDIHWNPVRIVQRFGRIDRIGSQNEVVQLVNFWPDVDLDEYINLKARVESRMNAVNLTATGDDNVLKPEQEIDLEYRKTQLKRMQEEVVDLEDINTGISIMDLGLNEYRLDLLNYIKENPDIEDAPKGMNAIVKSKDELDPGVIFVLKNLKEDVNINGRNRLHPFYMVYISDKGEIIINHLEPKKLLDYFRLLAKDKNEPDTKLCKQFNKETKNGRKMEKYSNLLEETIKSIIEVKDITDLDSFLSGEDTSFLNDKIEGLDDFELISFLIIKNGD